MTSCGLNQGALVTEGNRPGEITIHPSENWIENETRIDMEGIHALYFIFQGKGSAEMLKFGFRKKA